MGIESLLKDKKINFNEVKIIIASSYYKEILEQLYELGLKNVEVARLNLDSETLIRFEDINLGRFLMTMDEKIKLPNMTFVSGGSALMDYLFLRALAIKFNVKNYLEIGTFLGESIDSISDVVEKCYSISLPNSEMEPYLESNNISYKFGKYFSFSHSNCTNFEEDSKTFDYSKINETLDLVFIDGDHSYQGVYIDTKNIFKIIDLEKTIVVWHDLRTIRREYRMPVAKGIFDALGNNKGIINRIYGVDKNLCAIYIPDCYKDEFEFSNDKNILHSFEVNVMIKENRV